MDFAPPQGARRTAKSINKVLLCAQEYIILMDFAPPQVVLRTANSAIRFSAMRG